MKNMRICSNFIFKREPQIADFILIVYLQMSWYRIEAVEGVRACQLFLKYGSNFKTDLVYLL